MPIRYCLLLPLLFSLAASSQAEADEPPGERHVYKTVKGDSGPRELKIYISKPDAWQATDTRPAIVFFHGGGWVGGAPGQFDEHAQYFASRGLVCFQVEYRLLNRSDKEPPINCVADAESAMRWVRSQHAKFGIDPNRIASAGGSAGGHLAAYVGTVDAKSPAADEPSVSPKSNAMLLFNPVYDNGPGGWGTERVGDRYREFSPLHNLSADDPPSIVFLGTEDKLIPVSTAEKFRDTAQELGVTSELHTYPGQPHGFFNFAKDNGRWYYETVLASDRFLAKLGWLSGEPTLAQPTLPVERTKK